MPVCVWKSVEYEPAWPIGANCGIDDVATVAEVTDQCNDFGMDAIEIGHCFSVLMEATKRGCIGDEHGLAWSDTPGVVALAEAIARR